jgi:hypothetical protein
MRSALPSGLTLRLTFPPDERPEGQSQCDSDNHAYRPRQSGGDGRDEEHADRNGRPIAFTQLPEHA